MGRGSTSSAHINLDGTSIYRFYDSLTDEKTIWKDSPLKYQELLTSLGYTTSSVDVCISAVNNFLNYCDHRGIFS